MGRMRLMDYGHRERMRGMDGKWRGEKGGRVTEVTR